MRLIDADAMAESLEYDTELDARALDNTELVGAERERIQFDKDCKQNCMWYLTEQPTIDAVEVVRCKDCFIQPGCQFAQYQGNRGYCSLGERRES